MTLAMSAPNGDRGAAAPLRAQRAAIEDLFARLSARDRDGVLALFTTEAVVAMPFQPPGFPTIMLGRDQIRDALAMLDIYESAPFTMRVTGAGHRDDRGEWMVQVEGHLVVRATGRPYRNRYTVTVKFGHGLISQLTAYHDPLVQRAAYEMALADDSGDAAWERAAIERWLGLLFAQDFGSALDMLAEDVTVDVPWHIPGLPGHTVGRAEVCRRLGIWSELWLPGLLHTVTARRLAAPHTWLTEVEGELVARDSQRVLHSASVGEIGFRRGKIDRIRQYPNLLAEVIALGADIPGINVPGTGVGPRR
ncbi:nuclear transport factor 2 family protein [Nocardia transvalensis]|uniref:nuclear transport factor 2 family protein n=1 Tax=Nocardia transvalensis TaxID=37333 RepID=UPI0018948CD7|nr:nuclear transport factor 2 family protein [Nocardia transvalensis]MBF6328045.1 nuclear transport factor 2 family protein [Nocardia transvalensis]